MSVRDKLITYSFKSKKGSSSVPDTKRKSDVLPSTSGNKPSSYDKDIQILKEFDLNAEYGPCIGITRLERWTRAEKHSLNPSQKVKQIISEHPDDERYTLCLWNDYKNVI